jgi:hypothetical protein
VDYQPDFDDHSLVPVDHDPFAAEGLAQQWRIQQAQAQPQGPLQQQPATGAGQPDAGAPTAVGVLAALVVFPAHSQNLSVLDHAVAITTSLQFITEDDVDQRTKLNLLLAQKQVSREEVIGELGVDVDRIVKAESAGLLSDALVDKAFADMCSRLNVAPADLMKSLEEKGIRLDTLRKRLKSDVAREHLARMPSHGNEDRLDHPLIPKK